MRLLCRFGLHRWESFGALTKFCTRCKAATRA